jgi:hypothetical protein
MEKSVIIDGFQYDIRNFKHPGGSVIHFYTEGQDASQAFHEFHYRSKKAKQILKTLNHKPVDNGVNNVVDNDKEMLDDFNNLRMSFEKRGYFKPNSVHIFFRTTELIAIYFAAIFLHLFSFKTPIFI